MADKDESLTHHLEALRKALIKCFVCLGILLPVCLWAAPKVLNFFTGVLIGDSDIVFNYFSPMEVFIIQIKLAFFMDLVLAFPYIVKNIWGFILPALYDKEKKFIKSMVISSTLLFCGGVAFCVFLILPLLVKFGLSFSSHNMQAVFGVSNIISLSLWLALVFGLMFQFPLVTYSLIKADIVSYKTISTKRPYVFIGILILSAVLTPPDVVSQFMLTLPTYLLFELGLLFARRIKKTNSAEETTLPQ